MDLHVDVLYSYNTDIRKQTAYIERNERNPHSLIIADDRWTFDNKPTFTYTDVTGGQSANITLDVNLTANSLCCVFSVINEEARISYAHIGSVGSNLPDISASHYQNALAYNYAITPANWMGLAVTISQQQSLASFVYGVNIYPFGFYHPNLQLYVAQQGTFHIGSTDTGLSSGAIMAYDYSPRLIVADFDLPAFNNFFDIEPYKECQLYIPFYNNLYTFNLKKTAGHNILVYYTTQFSTGNSSVTIYDKTSGQILLTSPVELAQKLGVTTTNAWDINIERKQVAIAGISDALNSWFKMLASGATSNIIGGIKGVQEFSSGMINLVMEGDRLQDTANIQITSASEGIYNPLKVYLITKKLTTLVNDTQIFYEKNGYPIHSWDDLDITGYEYTGYTELSQLQYIPDTQKHITTTEISEIEELAKNGIIL